MFQMRHKMSNGAMRAVKIIRKLDEIVEKHYKIKDYAEFVVIRNRVSVLKN